MPFSDGGYGVSNVEIESFVRDNPCVANWLKKYSSATTPQGRDYNTVIAQSQGQGDLSGSKMNKARILCRFFKWLRVEQEVSLTPSQLLNRQLKLRQSSNVEDRQWLLSLVLQHSRDNPHFRDYCDMRKYDIFMTVKSFCDYHEVVLTTAKRVFGKIKRKKSHKKQVTPTQAKKVLGEMSQRDRTISLIQWESGMGIGEVLDKFNYMWHSQVEGQLHLDRMKVEFDERKRNGTYYFTFVSRDAIHELRKWLEERRRIVDKLVANGKDLDEAVLDGEPIFITSRGTPLTVREIAGQFNRRYQGKVTTHMFRKLFESEAKVPEHGIDREYVKFFMGHAPELDEAGGTYDRNVEIRQEIFEREYAKLEPYINIYSGVQAEPLTQEDREWSEFSNALRETLEQKDKREKFMRFIKQL